MLVRKKPVVVQAVQFFFGKEVPGVVQYKRADGTPEGSIKTLEGTMYVREGDWIITGVKGEMYPCREDIFKETYEFVESYNESEYDELMNKKRYL